MERIRYSLTHPEGQENLNIYESAVAIMKGDLEIPRNVRNSEAINALDANGDNFVDPNSPFSWQNQANVHSSQCAHRSQHFFPWHRVAIHYLEEAVRATTGETDFTLPYWNWNDEDQRSIPEAFRDNESPLYETDRRASINAGEEIQDEPNMDESANMYVNPENFGIFSRNVEGIHGTIHVLVGGKMSDASRSAEDPIFWLHHNNVDRLWAKHGRYKMTARDFNEIDESRAWPHPDGAIYTFTDRNGDSTGNLKNNANAVLNLTHRSDVHYQDYDENGVEILLPTRAATSDIDLSTLNPCFINPAACLPKTDWRQLIKLPYIKIQNGLIELKHSEDKKDTKNRNFRSTLNITYSSDKHLPGSIDILYGDGPKRNRKGKIGKNLFPSQNQSTDKLINNNPKFANKYFAGTIGLFEADPEDNSHQSHTGKDHITDPGFKTTAAFDITSIIRKQQNNPKINDQIFLNIDPTQKYADELAAALNIESISVDHFTLPKSA